MLKNQPQAILIDASQREITHNDLVVPNNLTNEHPWERVGRVGEREREEGAKQRDKKENIEKGDLRENEWDERKETSLSEGKNNE